MSCGDVVSRNGFYGFTYKNASFNAEPRNGKHGNEEVVLVAA